MCRWRGAGTASERRAGAGPQKSDPAVVLAFKKLVASGFRVSPMFCSVLRRYFSNITRQTMFQITEEKENMAH